ncbi:flippase (plasmid) [Halarchaeum sp. CBA1220]|uniref:flippase n=1 Tax=Halarchaeum sp. CBA1220 TaxID=1853682 RepID=UPI000F3A8D61|nr:flippase [Halarchaeum sp. CBA1220]QLC35111.1 flippase [Halarchaeum sp. CBA1220]
MSDVRRLVRNASFLFVGSAIADAGAFGFRLLVANEFGASEFGLYSVSLMTVSVLTSIALLGLPDGVISFGSRFRSKGQSDKVVGVLVASFVIIIPLSTLSSVFLWMGAPDLASIIFQNSDLVPILRKFTYSIPAKSIASLTGAFCLSYERAGLSSIIRQVFPKAGPFIAAVFVVLSGGGLVAIIEVYVILLWVIAIGGLVVTYSIVKKEGFNRISTNFRSLLKFSTPLFISGFIGFFLNWTDTLLVGYFMTSSDVGVYQAAFLLATSIAIFQRVISDSLYPNFGSLLANDEEAMLRERYRSGVEWVVVLTAAPCLFLILFSRTSLLMLFGTDFGSGWCALIILLLAQFAAVSIGPATNLLKIMGFSRYILGSYIVAVFANTILNVFLIPRYGLLGAGIATSVGILFSNIPHFVLAKHKAGITLPYMKLGSVVFIAATVSISMRILLDKPETILSFILFISVFSMIYTALLIMSGIVNVSDLARLSPV